MWNKSPVLFSLSIILIGIGCIVFALIPKFDLFFLSLGMMLTIIPITVIKNQLKPLPTIEERTYEWYKEQYPNCVRDNIIMCYTCENNLVDVRPVSDESPQQEYYCTLCGKTLYYSAQ